MPGDELKPALTLIDVQRGWKEVGVTLKSGDAATVRVTAISWEDLGALHLEHGTNAGAVERALIERCLPAALSVSGSPSPSVPLPQEREDSRPPASCGWIEWMDMESRNVVMRVVREFAYGFATEKKRAAALESISKRLFGRNGRPPSSVSGSDSATPSAGPDPSCSATSSESAGSRLTTA